MKKILIIFFIFFFYQNSSAIDLSDYSSEERAIYKEIKQLKKDKVTGKNWIKEEYWIKDKENFYHQIAAFHTGIEGLRIKPKQMPILGIKVGGNWNWKSGKKKANQKAFSVIGAVPIENGEMGIIESEKHAWHGKEFFQITGSYENCNPQYWEFKECDHHRGSVHNESRDKQKWTKILSKEGGEAWIHIATRPVRNILFPYNPKRKFHIAQCHPKGDVITFMLTYQGGRLYTELQFPRKQFELKKFKVNEHNGADEWTSVTLHLVNSANKDVGRYRVWIDDNEQPIVDYKGRTSKKGRINCFLASGIYINAKEAARDMNTTQDSTVWADAVAIAKTKEKLLKLIEKKDK